MIGPRRNRDWWEASGSLVPWYFKTGFYVLLGWAVGVLLWW